MQEIDPRILELREKRKQSKLGGGEKRIASQHSKGKLFARERLELLLDPGTFYELEPYTVQRGDHMGGSGNEMTDGVVTGFGQINNRTVYVYSQDFTIQGGSLGEMQGKKIARLMDLAASTGCPVIGMLDSGGARIQEGVKSLGGYADIFQKNIMASGVVPQISAIFGPCAGGAVYSPALTDFTIMTKDTSYMFVTGPKVVKTVTGENVTDEELGGAMVHGSKSGVTHFVADDEQEGILLIRKILSYLPQNNLEDPPLAPCDDPIDRLEDALNEIIPESANKPYDVKDVIYAVADYHEFLEIQRHYAPNIITGFARFNRSEERRVGKECRSRWSPYH